MNCNHSIQHIYTGEVNDEFTRHIEECESCRKLNEKVNQSMSLLETSVEIPAGLTQKVMQNVSNSPYKKRKVIDFGKYIQVAAVVAAGIFIGVLLGTNANSNLLVSKKSKKDAAYEKFKQNHHFTENDKLYIFN